MRPTLLRPTLRLTVGPDHVRGERLQWTLRGRRVTWTADATHGGPADLADVIAQLVAEPALRRVRRVTVSVEPPLVQLRRLEGLPPVRSAALGALVAHQAMRFFRRTATPLITDAVWLRGQPRSLRAIRQRAPRVPRAARVAQAAAIEAPWVEAIATGARSAGMALDRVRPAGADVRLQLLSPAIRAATRRRALLGLRQLVAVTAALWLAVGVAYVGRLRQAGLRADAELAALAEPLAAVTAARRAMGEARAMVAAVEADERQRGRVTATLGRLAAALPDSAYLTALTLGHDGAGAMTGHARRAAEVIAALERTGAVAGPRLDATGARVLAGSGEWEPFTVRFGAPGPAASTMRSSAGAAP